jgi:Fe2+ transport system protein FeoA
MAESVVRTLNSLFLEDSAEFTGAFQREMIVKFSSKPEDTAAHVAGTSKYLTFVASKAQTCAPGLGPDDLVAMADRVAGDIGARVVAGELPGLEDIRAAVRAGPEWQAWQTDRIHKVAEMCDVQLSDGQVQRLMDTDGIDALRIAIENIEDACDPEPAPEQAVPAPVEARKPSLEAVDERFVDAFEAEYGRDPTVHEYVHVRNILADSGMTLKELHGVHFTAYAAFEEIYREYMDELLSESAFCKRFLPAALMDPKLAERQRDTVLESQGYRRTMLDRLSSLHSMLFGESITEEEGEYMFEREVRSQRLALRSDKLNDIVVKFAEQTTRLFERITDIYKATLGREPEDSEVREVLQSFRLLDKARAESELRRTLTGSLEFREVLRLEIVKAKPDLSTAAVFRALETVLSLPGLSGMTAEQAVARVFPAPE